MYSIDFESFGGKKKEARFADFGEKQFTFARQQNIQSLMKTLLRGSFLLLLLFIMPWAALSPCAQVSIVWPMDYVGSCEESLEDVTTFPAVQGADACGDSQVQFEDAELDVMCDQSTVIDRTWTVTACDSVFMHVQRIELLDNEAPYVFNATSSNHFFANEMSWLPVLRDKCDASLEGEISFSDTLPMCCGVMSFSVNLDIPDDCGNVLDTSYTVFLHDLEPYLDCEINSEGLCGEGTTFDEETGTCIPLNNGFPDASACGPNTTWDASLGLCVPATLSSPCFFDTNGDGTVGPPDLLNFLSAYGQECTSEDETD